MLAQNLIVAVLVAGCTVYAAWRLMPAMARRAIARALLELPLPAKAEAILQKALAPISGCDGCDHGSASKPLEPTAAGQPITFYPRIKPHDPGAPR